MSKTKREFECKNDPDDFCYVCGDYVVEKKIRKFTDSLRKSYLQYFKVAPENLNERWTPNAICSSCHVILSEWASGSKKYVFVYIFYLYMSCTTAIFAF